MAADDERIARALRELPRRSGMSQIQAAEAAGVSIRMLRRAERDGASDMPPVVLRRVFQPFDARVRLSVWWNGAELDRILDEAHAAVVEQVVGLLAGWGWSTAPEVSFSEYGERGSIDTLGLHAASGCGLVVEVKASWGSLEETNRVLDVKARLAPKLIEERFGVRPASVSRLLVLPEDVTLRRVAGRHSATLAAVYPLRSREVRAWLRRPAGPMRGLWFLSKKSVLEDE